jgi:hypothetical protein
MEEKVPALLHGRSHFEELIREEATIEGLVHFFTRELALFHKEIG